MFSTAAPRKNPESRGACVGGAIKPAFTPPVVDEQPTVTKPATLNTSASNTTRRRSFRSRPEQQLFSIFASNFFMDLVALTRHSTSSVPTFNYPLLVPLIQTLRQQMTRTNFRRRLLKYRFWLWRARRVPSEINVALAEGACTNLFYLLITGRSGVGSCWKSCSPRTFSQRAEAVIVNSS